MSELEEALEDLRALPETQRRAAALLANERFQRAVELLAAEDDDALLVTAGADDAIAGAVALEALARRPRNVDLLPTLRR